MNVIRTAAGLIWNEIKEIEIDSKVYSLLEEIQIVKDIVHHLPASLEEDCPTIIYVLYYCILLFTYHITVYYYLRTSYWCDEVIVFTDFHIDTRSASCGHNGHHQGWEGCVIAGLITQKIVYLFYISYHIFFV